MSRKKTYTAQEVSIMLGEKDARIEELNVRLRREKKRHAKWFQIGEMKNGDGIYCDGPGNLAILKDFRYLVEPTQEEVEELRQRKWATKE